MSTEQNDRYEVLRQIDWFSLDRVQEAMILVVGAGAIGNEVLKNLALLGIGRILIVDPDTIEASNLSRSILFREHDLGRPKAEVAARAIRQINPQVEVIPFIGRIEEVFGLGVWRRIDVVIGCLDNRAARYYVNRTARLAGSPWINAGIGALNGQVQVFLPGEHACYECQFSDSAYEEIRISCGIRDRQMESERRVPTTPTIASLVAAIQVQETLKLLDVESWADRTLAGREFKFHGSIGEAESIKLPHRDDCPAHDVIQPEEIIERPDCRVERTSAAEILNLGVEALGRGAFIQLGFELAVERACPNCQSRTRLLKPRLGLRVDDLLCPECGRLTQIVTTHHLGRPTSDYIEDFLELPLASIGIAPLEMIQILGPAGEQTWIELTGDLETILP